MTSIQTQVIAVASAMCFPSMSDKLDATGAQSNGTIPMPDNNYVITQGHYSKGAYIQHCVMWKDANRAQYIKPCIIAGFRAVSVSLAIGPHVSEGVEIAVPTMGVVVRSTDQSISVRVKMRTVVRLSDNRTSGAILFFLRYDTDPLLPSYSSKPVSVLAMGQMPGRLDAESLSVEERASGTFIVTPHKFVGVAEIPVKRNMANTIMLPTSALSGFTIGRMQVDPGQGAYYIQMMASGKVTVPLLMEFVQKVPIPLLVLDGFKPTWDEVMEYECSDEVMNRAINVDKWIEENGYVDSDDEEDHVRACHIDDEEE